MNQVPTKIVLKSTTRMSLNDRFSNIAPSTQTIRANVAAEHQVSAANRRLAQQLANRPGIPQTQVATMYNRQPGRMRRGSLQQRLGQGNIKARLSLPNPQLQGRGRGGRGRGNFQQGPSRNGNPWSPPQNQGRGGFSMRMPRGQNNRGRGRGGQFNRFMGQSTNIRGGRGARGGPGNRGPRRGGRGGFRGRGRGGRGGRPQASVEDLDSQLDAYMSKSKTSLDSQLDVYMKDESA